MSINKLRISPTPSNTSTNTPTITASLTACPTNTPTMTPTNTPSPTNICCSAYLISFSTVPSADYISWYNCDGVPQTGFTNSYRNFIIYNDDIFGSIYVNHPSGYTITNIGCVCTSTCNQINITGISGETVFYKTCNGFVDSATTPVSFCADGSSPINPFTLPISFGDTTGFTVSVECCPTPQITSSPTATPTMTPSTTPCFNPQAFAIFDRNSLRFDLNDYMLANSSAFRGMNINSPSTVAATFQTQMNLYIDYSGWGASNNAIMFEPTSFNEEPIDIINTNSWSDDFTWVSAFVPSCSSCAGYYEYFGEQGTLALSNTVYSSIEFYYSGNVVQQGFYRLYTTKPGTANRYFNDNGVYTVSGLTCTGSTPTPTSTPTSTPSITPSNTTTQTNTPTNTSTPTNTPTITPTATCPVFTTQYLQTTLQSCHNFQLKLFDNPDFTGNANALCDYVVSGCAYGDLGTVYCGTETIASGEHTHNFSLQPVLQPGECVSAFTVNSITYACPCVNVVFNQSTPTPTPTITQTTTPTGTPSITPTMTPTTPEQCPCNCWSLTYNSGEMPAELEVRYRDCQTDTITTQTILSLETIDNLDGTYTANICVQSGGTYNTPVCVSGSTEIICDPFSWVEGGVCCIPADCAIECCVISILTNNSLDVSIETVDVNGSAATLVGGSLPNTPGNGTTLCSTTSGTVDITVSTFNSVAGQKITLCDSNSNCTCYNITGTGPNTWTFNDVLLDCTTPITILAEDGSC